MKKDFSVAQKEYLEKKMTAFVIAKDNLNSFIDFLKKELQIDDTWTLCSDLSGFQHTEDVK